MSTTESKKKSDDSAMDLYLNSYDVYKSSDLGIDIAAVIRYAREQGIPLASVPQKIIEQNTKTQAQMVG